MPFCRRGIGHRLHTGISIRQRRRQRHGQAACALQGGQQRRRIRYYGACVGGHAAGPSRSVSGSRPAPEFLGRRVTLATSQHKMQVRQPGEIVQHCCQIHFRAAWQWKRANVRRAREFRQNRQSGWHRNSATRRWQTQPRSRPRLLVKNHYCRSLTQSRHESLHLKPPAFPVRACARTPPAPETALYPLSCP
jgi:hypothetical protein